MKEFEPNFPTEELTNLKPTNKLGRERIIMGEAGPEIPEKQLPEQTFESLAIQGQITGSTESIKNPDLRKYAEIFE